MKWRRGLKCGLVKFAHTWKQRNQNHLNRPKMRRIVFHEFCRILRSVRTLVKWSCANTLLWTISSCPACESAIQIKAWAFGQVNRQTLLAHSHTPTHGDFLTCRFVYAKEKKKANGLKQQVAGKMTLCHTHTKMFPFVFFF